MTDTETTQKIEPIARPNHAARLAEHLERALYDASEVGEDIADAIGKLLESVKRREMEAKLERLPDITHAAEAA